MRQDSLLHGTVFDTELNLSPTIPLLDRNKRTTLAGLEPAISIVGNQRPIH